MFTDDLTLVLFVSKFLQQYFISSTSQLRLPTSDGFRVQS